MLVRCVRPAQWRGAVTSAVNNAETIAFMGTTHVECRMVVRPASCSHACPSLHRSHGWVCRCALSRGAWPCCALQHRALLDYTGAIQELHWRRIKPQLLNKLFHVGPIQIAFCLVAWQMWAAPWLVRAFPTAASTLGVAAGYEGVDAPTAAARSEAVALTILSVSSCVSALMALVRTYANLDTSFAAAHRIMTAVDAMDAAAASRAKQLAVAAGAVVHREGMGGVTLDGVTVLAPSRGGLEGDAFIRGLCLDLDVGSACVITGPRCAAVGCVQCLVLKTDDGLVALGQWVRQDVLAACDCRVVAPRWWTSVPAWTPADVFAEGAIHGEARQPAPADHVPILRL